jgi:hypothetical protein
MHNDISGTFCLEDPRNVTGYLYENMMGPRIPIETRHSELQEEGFIARRKGPTPGNIILIKRNL